MAEKRKVGRPRKTERNPFIFSDKIVTNKIVAYEKLNRVKKSNGRSDYTSNIIDEKKNSIHIQKDILELLSRKDADTTMTAIFLYILSKLYWNREQLELEPEEIACETGFSVPRVIRVLGKLKKLNIIQRKKGRKHNHYYWINPKMIFYGDRISYIEKQLREDEKLSHIIDLRVSNSKIEIDKLVGS